MNTPHEHEEAVFEAALQLPREQRAAYLNKTCGDDPRLHQRIEALLQAHEQAGGFMADPAAPPPGPTVHLSLPVTEKAGDKIGHYKLLQQIGEGGCGVVYMAEQEEPIRRRVAFKVIKLGMDTKQVIARFEAERQALALMDHPNIAKVLDAGATETGRPYFVMELVRGIKITDYCDQNNLPTEARLDLFIQVCHAIQHAHQKGIIHRDIKPSNILVTVNDGVPVPKVIDFGIAKATEQRLTDKTLFTAFEQFIGTPAYMSPEQAEMTSLDIDTRSDIYALGVLLYELLTGKTPFDAKELIAAGLDEMRRIIREQEPPRPSTRISTLGDPERTTVAERRQVECPKLIHQVRGDLDWIVMKCLEKDRTRRYETANGLATDIERHLKHEPVSAAAPGAVYRVRKFVRRHQVGMGMAAAVLVLLVTGVVVSTWQAVRATRAEKKARAEATKSGQVAQFLKDMLEGVGPSVALGRDTTMLREILDKTAERVGKDLKDQPEVEAQLRTTLGELYRVLSQFENSERMHRQALAIQKQLFPGDHADVALSLNDLALVLDEERKVEEAEALAREALEMRRRLLGRKHRQVGESLVSLGILLQHRGKFAEAEAAHREALALWREIVGNECQETAISLNSLAQVLQDQGRLADAEAMERDALEIQKKILGPKHPDVATSLNNLAILLQNLGKLPAAEATHREALPLLIELYGTNHSHVAVSLNSLASVLNDEGKFVEAEAKHREALAIQIKLLGDKHPDVAFSLNNLANVMRAVAKPLEAEAMFRQAAEILSEKLGPEHPTVATLTNNLGRALREQGKLEEAEAAQRAALALRRKVLPKDHPAVAISLADLALVLRDRGNLLEAASTFQQALDLRRRVSGNEDIGVAVSLEYLASLAASQGQFAEAEQKARECLGIRQKKLPDDWRTFGTHSILGGCLAGQKKYAEAEPWLLSGYQGMEERDARIPAFNRFLKRQAIEGLVQLYEATGRADATAEWKKKLVEFNQAERMVPSLPRATNSSQINRTDRTP